MKAYYLPLALAGTLMLAAWGTPKFAAPSALTAPTPVEGSAGHIEIE